MLKSLAALAVLGCASLAHADSFNVSYLAAGVQASSDSTYVENFNNATLQNGTYTTNFNGSGVTGTYTGTVQILPAGLYGGANGTGNYIAPGGGGTSYTLTLSQNVNYFGLWFSALDAGNELQFYNNGNLVFNFTPQAFSTAVGNCPGSAYCGNPNNTTEDSGEQFAFINFYDANGSFNQVKFSELAGAGGNFESDNHTIGNLSSTPGGTPLSVTPEPSSLALLGTGAVGFLGFVRRRLA